MLLWERIAPSYVGRGGFAPIMRLTGVIGLGAGFLVYYQRSIRALYLPLGIRCPSELMWNVLDEQYDSTASQKTSARSIWI
jgi:hypothetical protein